MGERSRYEPGTFSWTDLSTTDQPAAKRFYSELFGWQATDNPVGDGAVYSMMSIDDQAVAAISPQPQQQRDAGVPPSWNSYVTVESADESAARARELGGSVHAGPFDVMDVGRMAVIADPQGAFFMLWEPREHIGASLVNAPGALAWNELATPDLDASTQFYSELFGWKIEPLEASPTPYLWIQAKAGHSNGGIRPLGEGEPPNWLVYFGVEDVEQGLERIEALGGTKLAGPIDAGPVRIAVAQDPQGAVFAITAGDFDD